MIPENVNAVLREHGLTALEFESGTTQTSVQAAHQIGVEVGQIAKSMLVRGKNGKYYLIVCAGDARLSNKKMKSVLGVKTRMATQQETREVTGFNPGGVCPFGLGSVEIFIDRGLAQYDVIYPAAGTDGSGVATNFAQLCEICDGRPCDVCVQPAPHAQGLNR